jgi:GGDEF domain-containing protein
MAHTYLGKFDQALAACDELILLGRVEKNNVALAKGLLRTGYIKYAQNELAESHALIWEAERLANTTNNIDLRMRAAISSADSYAEDGNFPRALEGMQAAVTWTREHGNRVQLAVALNSLAKLYSKMREYDKGFEALDEAMALAAKSVSPGRLALLKSTEYRLSIATVRKTGRQAAAPGRAGRIRRARSNSARLCRRGQGLPPRTHAVERAVREAPPEGDARAAGKVRRRQAPAPDRTAAPGKPGQEHRDRQPPPAAARLVAAGAGVRAVRGDRLLLYRKVRQANAQLEEKNLELKQQSARDPLTALYNRRHFQEFMRGHQEIARARRQRRGDGQRPVPDGRRPLQAHQRHLRPRRRRRGAARNFGRPARDPARDRHDRALGRRGIPGLPAGGAAQQPGRRGAPPAERHPGPQHRLPGHQLSVNVSIGFAPFPLAPGGKPMSWERAVNLVDMALYLAKGHGRNRAYGVQGFTTIPA